MTDRDVLVRLAERGEPRGADEMIARLEARLEGRPVVGARGQAEGRRALPTPSSLRRPRAVRVALAALLSRGHMRRRPLLAAAAAAAVLVLVGGVALLVRIVGADDPPVVTTPEPPPTIQTLPSDWPLGAIFSGPSGIAVVPFDSPDEPILLQSDDRYRGISWAISDHRGGLIFTHDVTPPPWAPGSVLWLRAGADAPELLIPPAGPWVPDSYPVAGVTVVGMATSSEGHALLVYVVQVGQESELSGGRPMDQLRGRIMVADLDDGGSSREVAELDGWVQPDFGRYWVTTGGGVVVVLDVGSMGSAFQPDDCYPVTVLSVDDGTPIPVGLDCVPFFLGTGYGPWEWASHDGRSVAVRTESAVTVIDLATGETFDGGPMDVRNVVPASSPGGWLAAVFTDSQIRLVDLDGDERYRVEVPAGEFRFFTGRVHFYHHPVVLNPTAALGSGSGEVPCRPTTAELEDQDLPEPVAATRRLLYDLAASCDYDGLASLAIGHEALVSAGGWLLPCKGTGCPLVGQGAWREDLVSSWITDGLFEPQAAGMRSREPLASLAALLGTRPAHVEDIPHWPVYDGPPDDPYYEDRNPEPTGCVWVWPALYVGAEGDPGDSALWSEHYDYRIGIDADGVWRFFMADAYERGVSPVPPPCGDG